MKSILFFMMGIVLFNGLFAQVNEGKLNIAVVELTVTDLPENSGQLLADRLSIELFQTGKFNVLERSQIDEILKEQSFQLSGCTSTECMVEVGKLLGVQAIVGGSIGRFGNMYTMNIRMVDVETGSMIRQATFDYKGEMEKLLTDGMKIVAYKLAGMEIPKELLQRAQPKAKGEEIRPAPGRNIGVTIFQSGEDIVIMGVIPNSLASSMGLKSGDKILEVNGINVKGQSPANVRQLIHDGLGNNRLVLLIERDGKTFYVSPQRQKIKSPSTGTSSRQSLNTQQMNRKNKKPDLRTKKVAFGFEWNEGFSVINVKEYLPELNSRGIFYKDNTTWGNFCTKLQVNLFFPKQGLNLFLTKYFTMGFLSDDTQRYHSSYSDQVDKDRAYATLMGLEIYPVNYLSFAVGYATSEVKLFLNNNVGGGEFSKKSSGAFYNLRIHFVNKYNPYKIGLEYHILKHHQNYVQWYSFFFGFYF